MEGPVVANVVLLGESDRLPAGARWTDAMAAELGPDHQVIAEGLGGRTTVHDDPIEGAKDQGSTCYPRS